MKTKGAILGLILALSTTLLAGEANTTKVENTKEVILRLLKASGAVTTAMKAPYGSGIKSLYLGYAENGQPLIGIAVRKTKTYKETETIIAVIPKGGTYTVSAAEIPELGTFKPKYKTLAADALKDITGKIFTNGKEARGLADVVTGATKYKKQIYVSYALMASKVIGELTAKPTWPRTKLTP